MKRKLHFLLAVGIGLTTSVGWLHAADTHHVFNVPAGDVMALRDSIAKAAEGDTVKLPPADYNLTSPLVINKPIVIVGTIPDGRGLETKIIAVKNDDWPKNAEAISARFTPSRFARAAMTKMKLLRLPSA